MMLDMVYPGRSSEVLLSTLLPITMVTAIVSPNARPRPRMTAPRMPEMP